ncbi:MAG: ATP-binding protein [Bacteroides sp.]|nr:ATP-binding protein [Bacteroides sp.]
MSYLQKYYVMAENELNGRKSRNRELQQANIALAEERIPKIKELRRQLLAGGAKLASVLVSSGDPKSAVQSIAKENMSVNREIKALLVRGGFKEGFLDPIYSCEKCRDTGIFGGKRCTCFMSDVERFQCLELNASSALNLCSFETFDLSYYPNKADKNGDKTIREIMSEVLSFCKRYAENFHLPSNGILMSGGTGLGKTHLSLSVGSEVIKKGYSVIYGSAPDLFRKVEREHFDGSVGTDTAQLLQDCDLLIIDDLGAEFESKFYLSVLYELLNTRMNTGKPIVVNTNYTVSELQSRYVGRITSRLLTLDSLFFYGDDIRMIKKFNK